MRVPDLIMNFTNLVMLNLFRMAATVVTWESKSSTLDSHNRGHLFDCFIFFLAERTSWCDVPVYFSEMVIEVCLSSQDLSGKRNVICGKRNLKKPVKFQLLRIDLVFKILILSMAILMSETEFSQNLPCAAWLSLHFSPIFVVDNISRKTQSVPPARKDMWFSDFL